MAFHLGSYALSRLYTLAIALESVIRVGHKSGCIFAQASCRAAAFQAASLRLSWIASQGTSMLSFADSLWGGPALARTTWALSSLFEVLSAVHDITCTIQRLFRLTLKTDMPAKKILKTASILLTSIF